MTVNLSLPSQELGEGEQRGYQALFTVNEMVNLCDPSDPSSFSKAHSLAHTFFSQRNGDSQHTAHAMGHCHIDSGLSLMSKMCPSEYGKLSRETGVECLVRFVVLFSN